MQTGFFFYSPLISSSKRQCKSETKGSCVVGCDAAPSSPSADKLLPHCTREESRQSRLLSHQQFDITQVASSVTENIFKSVLNTLSGDSVKRKISFGSFWTFALSQNMVSSSQSHSQIPTQHCAFEGTQVLKRDRTAHKSITLIEDDKNTNCALLNC